MIRLNVHEAKTHLSRYLNRLSEGEAILLCKRNTPIGEIRPLPSPRKMKRPLELAKGSFKVLREFFKPLPASLVKALQGD
jgi:antitoxin (DNA-binding transcriptional repressor) of toxin-antitoxin stability system